MIQKSTDMHKNFRQHSCGNADTTLLNWSNINDMAVNFTKTKDMVMGPAALSSNLPLIQWAEGQIERISSFKLLGLHLDADFSWHSHAAPVWHHSLNKSQKNQIEAIWSKN